jgi:hypothetical protein
MIFFLNFSFQKTLVCVPMLACTLGTDAGPVELFPQRSTNHEDAAFLNDNIIYHDPYDTQLYHEAQALFEMQVTYVKKWKNITI